MTRSRTLMGCAIFIFAVLPLAVHAIDIDASKPLLCSIANIKECTPDGDCQNRTAEEVAMPEFLKFDLQNKTVTPGTSMQGKQPSAIKEIDRIEGKLILQGAEKGPDGEKDGLGWTASISEDSGKLIFTASGDE